MEAVSHPYIVFFCSVDLMQPRKLTAFPHVVMCCVLRVNSCVDCDILMCENIRWDDACFM